MDLTTQRLLSISQMQSLFKVVSEVGYPYFCAPLPSRAPLRPTIWKPVKGGCKIKNSRLTSLCPLLLLSVTDM
jgi:hypothetical protein